MSFLLYGCASNTNKNIEYDKNSGFPFHGEFCGMNVPDTKGKSTYEISDILKFQKQPIDDIDAACQNHDICYADKGFGDRGCDEALIKELYSLGTLFNDPSCNTLVGEISAYFNIKTLNPAVLYDVSKMGVRTVGAASVGLMSLLLVPIIVITDIVVAPFEIAEGLPPFSSIKKIPAAAKELSGSPMYNIHPPRSTRCN